MLDSIASIEIFAALIIVLCYVLKLFVRKIRFLGLSIVITLAIELMLNKVLFIYPTASVEFKILIAPLYSILCLFVLYGVSRLFHTSFDAYEYVFLFMVCAASHCILSSVVSFLSGYAEIFSYLFELIKKVFTF